MWYYGGTPMGWGGIVMMALGMILFWGTLVVVGVLVLRKVNEGGRNGSALRVLEERLARGEIDTDEFDRVRKTLSTR
ncbi:SHOCT domain-containing protein [Lentzea alba]|uniref:SHOCT domain-containing protein n=1 Tax=Lentzea alba TaxID=2714351 RepID=UPI0039BF386B